MGSMIGIHQQAGIIQAYLAPPQKTAHFKGAVIVVHELWGLTEHIKSVADRLADQGYYALAPDLYSGKTVNRQLSEELQHALFDKDDAVRYAAQPKLREMLAPTQTPQFVSLALSRLASCFEYMYNQPLVHQQVALLGFGLGANYGYGLAIREQRLRGVIAFYGHAKYITAELRHITCPVLAIYGEADTALMQELPGLKMQMAVAGVEFEPVTYEGAGHAFFNDANAFAYKRLHAEDAWRDSLTVHTTGGRNGCAQRSNSARRKP